MQEPGRLGAADRVPRATDTKDRKASLACSLGATVHVGRCSPLKGHPDAQGWLGHGPRALSTPPVDPSTSRHNQEAGPGSSVLLHDTTSERAGVCVRARVCLHVLWECNYDPVAWKRCSLVRFARRGPCLVVFKGW